MKTLVLSLFTLLLFVNCNAQKEMTTTDTSKLPFYQIPEAPETYTAATVLARTIDGLGYRYYWATEGLTSENMKYKPSEEGRTLGQTLEHIYGLTQGTAHTVTAGKNELPEFDKTISPQEMRTRTLWNLKTASDVLRANPDLDLSTLNVIFASGGEPTNFPFWNQINGPLEDALWHTGQIVVLRRSAGNPIPKGVNVFIGKTKGE